MCKTYLRNVQMSDAVYINQASEWALWLTQREVRAPGDMESAWRRLEHRYGVPVRMFWKLRYRKPKTLSVSIYARIKHAIDTERERQFQLLQRDIEIAKATVGSNNHTVVQIEALVDTEICRNGSAYMEREK